MRIHRFMFLVTGALFLSSCTAQPTSNGIASGNATLQLKPKFQVGNLTVQSVITPYSSEDVNHLVIKVYKVSNGIETAVDALQQDIPNANLGNPVSIQHLWLNTTYRFKAFAYSAAGTDVNNLLNTQDASSSADVTLTNDDRPTLRTLPVQFIPRPFSGQATASNIVVATGSYIPNATISFEMNAY